MKIKNTGIVMEMFIEFVCIFCIFIYSNFVLDLKKNYFKVLYMF